MNETTKSLTSPASDNSKRVPVETAHCNIIKYASGSLNRQSDVVITEQPLEIVLHYQDLKRKSCTQIFSITMRTPGQDHELAAGLLFAEGIINHYDDIEMITLSSINENSDSSNKAVHNTIEVTISDNRLLDTASIKGNLATFSSCGLCGSTVIKALEKRALSSLSDMSDWLQPEIIMQLPNKLRTAQTQFALTGGVHGCGLFDGNGTLMSSAEDIGRHNALDKLIGQCQKEALLTGEIKHQSIIVLSGRVSVELVQKVIVACIPVIVAIGAPSSLAIKTAQRFNLTLIGFCTEKGFNLYNGNFRLIS